MKRPRCYVAHPMTIYGSQHEAQALRCLAQQLPGWELVNPAAMYDSDTAWLRSWPRLVRGLDLLVVVPAPDDTIGTGCIREVGDALRWQVPVLVLDHLGDLCELRGLLLLGPDARTARRAAWVMVGDQSCPAEKMGAHLADRATSANCAHK